MRCSAKRVKRKRTRLVGFPTGQSVAGRGRPGGTRTAGETTASFVSYPNEHGQTKAEGRKERQRGRESKERASPGEKIPVRRRCGRWRTDEEERERKKKKKPGLGQGQDGGRSGACIWMAMAYRHPATSSGENRGLPWTNLAGAPPPDGQSRRVPAGSCSCLSSRQ